MTKQYKTLQEILEQHIDNFFALHDRSSPESGLYERVMTEVERVLIQKTINHTDNVHSAAAKILGINRNTLSKKVKQLGIK